MQSVRNNRFWKRILFVGIITGLIMSGGCRSDNNVEFGIIADTQYADKENMGARNYRDSILLLEECAADFNNRQLSFVIQMGDIIDGGENAVKELQEVVTIHNRFKADKYHVLGNHDFWGIDREAVISTLGMEQAYYDFSIGRWRFVVLDTMDISTTGGWAEGSDNYIKGKEMLDELTERGAANAVEWSGGMGAEQKRWLGEVLGHAEKAGQKVLVFGHVALLPADDPHNLWNSEEIVDILESYDCVAVYFCGHRHSGGYVEQNGIHYITIEGMVEAGKENAYGVVRLGDGRLEIEGVGKVTSRTLLIEE
jgi:3',5'-cyclic AMP phosphodiesterase CpdA